MRTLLTRLALAAVVGVVGMIAAGAAQRPDDKPRAKVEFRRAETKPADGLTKAQILGTDKAVYLYPTAELTEKDVVGAALKAGPVIEITLTAEGAKKLEKLSEANVDKPLAILVDGKVIAAPTIRAKLGGNVEINGAFTPEEAAKLVKAINGQ
jgi:preprotein translocase subunit SecD